MVLALECVPVKGDIYLLSGRERRPSLLRDTDRREKSRLNCSSQRHHSAALIACMISEIRTVKTHKSYNNMTAAGRVVYNKVCLVCLRACVWYVRDKDQPDESEWKIWMENHVWRGRLLILTSAVVFPETPWHSGLTHVKYEGFAIKVMTSRKRKRRTLWLLPYLSPFPLNVVCLTDNSYSPTSSYLCP